MKKYYFIILIVLAYIQNIQTAYNIPALSNISILFLVFPLFLFIKYDAKKILFLITHRISIAFYLFIFSQFLTIFFSKNKISFFILFIKELIFLLPFFLIPFFLNIKLKDIIKIRYIIDVFLFLVIIGIILQFTPVNKFFVGTNFGDLEFERFTFENIHSFFAHHNVFAHIMLSLFILYYNTNITKLFKTIIFFVTIFISLSRTTIIAFLLILAKVKEKYLIWGFIVFFVLFFLTIENSDILIENISKYSISEINVSDFPRFFYFTKSIEIFLDHPIIGVGVNRITNRAYWEGENYYLVKKYQLQTEWGHSKQIELLSTDTYLVFIAEIGLVGTILFGYIFYRFILISKKINSNLLTNFLVAFILILFHTSFPFGDLSFGPFFLSAMGLIFNEYFYINKKNRIFVIVW